MRLHAVTLLRIVPIALCVAFALVREVKADPNRAHELFLQGNHTYEAGQYEQAAEAYRRALDEGMVNSRLYFNYANALYRLNRLGLAILHYEKGLKLSPQDTDIRYNLRFANARIVDKPAEPESNALTRFLWGAHTGYSLDQGVLLSLGLFSLVFLFIGLLSWAPSLKALWSLLAGVCLLSLLVLAPSLAFRIYGAESARHAVVLDSTLNLYSGPGEDYQLLSKIHEGTKVEVADAKETWALIKLPNGLGGYVRIGALGRI